MTGQSTTSTSAVIGSETIEDYNECEIQTKVPVL